MSDSESTVSVVIDSADIRCPVMFEKYTEENYPVTLPCGHTLSIQAFDEIRSLTRQCPSCRKAFAIDYIPQRTILWGNIAHQVRTKNKISCHNHSKEKAVAVCFEKKVFLCLDCLVEDNHRNDKVVTLKKLNSYLQDKKQNLVRQHEKAQQNRLNEIKVNEITQSILFSLEPVIRQIMNTELASYMTEVVDISQIMKKVDYLIEDNLVTGSVEVVEEMEKETKKLESENLQGDLEKAVDKITKRIIDQLGRVSVEKNMNQEERQSLTVKIDDNLPDIAQLISGKKFTEMRFEIKRNLSDMSFLTSKMELLKDLRTFQLDFSGNRYVDDVGLRELSLALKNFTSLTTLQLNFFQCTSISEAGLKELSLAIKNITSLSTLQLDLRCSSISNEGLKELSLTLKSIASLITLELDLYCCKKINDVALKELSLTLMNITSLTSLQLDFSRCSLISA